MDNKGNFKDGLKVQEVTHKLLTYWSSRPYLRLGQIISNAYRVLPEGQRKADPDIINDIYYLSDERLIVAIGLLEKMEEDERARKENPQS